MYECWNLPLTNFSTSHSNLYIIHLNGARIIHSPMTKPIAINNGSPITNMTNWSLKPMKVIGYIGQLGYIPMVI